MTLASVVLVIAIAAAFLVVGAPGARAAGGSAETALAALTDNSRAAAGLPGYTLAGDLAAVAARQATRMAASGAIYHNPDLRTDVVGWEVVGENVGVGADAEQVHDAFMNSPHHRDNILSSVYTEVGFGTAVGDDGRLYIAEVFRLPQTQAAPAPVDDPAPEPSPKAVEAPAPVAPVAVVDAVPAVEPPPALVAAPAPVVVREADLTDLRPQLVASFRPLPAVPRRAMSHLAWVAALLAQAVLIAHTLFWRRYRIGSGW